MGTDERQATTSGEPRGLDDPRTVRWIVRTLVAACIVLAALDLFVVKHSHLDFENWIGFFPIFGFLAYVIIVAGAKALRRLVMRDEDYYGEDEADQEPEGPTS